MKKRTQLEVRGPIVLDDVRQFKCKCGRCIEFRAIARVIRQRSRDGRLFLDTTGGEIVEEPEVKE